MLPITDLLHTRGDVATRVMTRLRATSECGRPAWHGKRDTADRWPPAWLCERPVIIFEFRIGISLAVAWLAGGGCVEQHECTTKLGATSSYFSCQKQLL